MAGIELKKAEPETVGLSKERITEFVGRLHEAEIPLHSMIVIKDDRLVFEAYQKPYGPDELHRMFSVTKSMVSLAIGLLADEGKLSLDDHIVDYFPEKLPEHVHPYIKALTIRNMLTMRAVHNKTTYKLAGCTDWVGSFFTTQPSHYPGTFYIYDTSSTHVLAALAEKLSGKELLAYLREKVLDDIGFSKSAYCLKDPMGVSMGGSGLMAAPMDLAKVMYLIMNGGVHNGKSYIPKEYLEQALDRWSDNYAVGQTMEEMQGYGYQFWRTTHDGYACFGMGGQLGICIPEKNMLIVTTADTQGRQGGVQLIYDALWSTILSDDAVTQNADAVMQKHDTIIHNDELEDCVKERECKDNNNNSKNTAKNVCSVNNSRICLNRDKQNGWYELPQVYLKSENKNHDIIQNEVDGHIITVDDNENGFKSFKLEFVSCSGRLIYENASGEHGLEFGIGKNVLTTFPEYGHRALVSGAWRNDNTFLIYVQLIDEYVGKVFMNFSFNDGHAGILFRKIEETYYKEFNLFTSGKLQ